MDTTELLFNAESNLIIFRPKPVLGYDNMMRFIDCIEEFGEESIVADRFLDLTGVETVELDLSDAEILAGFRDALSAPTTERKTAIIANSSLIEILIEALKHFANDSRIKIKICKDLDESAEFLSVQGSVLES